MSESGWEFETEEPRAWHEGWLDDLARAAAFLTRLPVGRGLPPGGSLANAMRAFPILGAAIGLLGGAVFGIAHWLLLPPLAGALLALTATILVTGALHEDGLADVADGFGGGTDEARRLEIMRDSRTGAFGVLALILGVGLRAAALVALAEPWLVLAGLVAAGAVGRAFLAAIPRHLPPARPDGLGAGAGRPTAEVMWTSAGIGAVIALLVLGIGAGLIATLAAGAAVLGVGHLARRLIGGHTGDVSGAAEQAAEVALLLAAAAMLGSAHT